LTMPFSNRPLDKNFHPYTEMTQVIRSLFFSAI
jgi:hypothetical protein